MIDLAYQSVCLILPAAAEHAALCMSSVHQNIYHVLGEEVYDTVPYDIFIQPSTRASLIQTKCSLEYGRFAVLITAT